MATSERSVRPRRADWLDYDPQYVQSCMFALHCRAWLINMHDHVSNWEATPLNDPTVALSIFKYFF